MKNVDEFYLLFERKNGQNFEILGVYLFANITLRTQPAILANCQKYHSFSLIGMTSMYGNCNLC